MYYSDLTIANFLVEASHCIVNSLGGKNMPPATTNSPAGKLLRLQIRAERQKCSNDWKFLVRFYLNRQAGHSSQSHGPFVLGKIATNETNEQIDIKQSYRAALQYLVSGNTENLDNNNTIFSSCFYIPENLFCVL